MYWLQVHKEAVDYYKSNVANLVKTIDGVEIWKDAYGYFRLITEEWDGTIYISSADTTTLERAEELANKMS